MNKGWHECNNNEMCFYPCGFNIPRIAHQLSNYADAIAGEWNRIRLNLMAEPHVCNSGRDSRDDVNNNNNNTNNNNEEQKQKTVKNGTKEKIKQECTARENNLHEILQGDEER